MVLQTVLCLAAVFGPAKLPTTPLTFTLRATTVDKALAKVSEATGVEFEVRAPLSNEVVVLRAKKVPADDLLGRLAKVLLARWSEDAGVWRLVRDEKAEAEEEAITRKRHLAFGERVLKEAKAKLAKQTPWSVREASAVAEAAYAWLKETSPGTNARMESARPISERTPGTRAALEAVTLLSKEQIAAVFEGRIVIASPANQAQYRLPNGVEAVVERFAREQTDWADAVEPKLNPATDNRDMRSRGWRPADHTYFEEMEPFTHIRRAEKPLGKTLLILNRSASGIRARLLVAGGNGDFVLFGLCWVSDPASQKPAAKTDERPLPFSDDSREHARALSFTSGRPKPPSPELLNRILEPEREDPLAYEVTDAVLGQPKDPDANVVACLPDTLSDRVISLAAKKQATYSEWESIIGEGAGVAVQNEGGFLTMRPHSPLWVRSLRTDRRALGVFLRKVVRENRFTLRDLVAFMRSNPEMYYFGLATTVVASLESEIYQRISRNDQDGLKILARLSVAEFDALEAGRTIPASALSTDVQKAIVKHFLNQDRLSYAEGSDGLSWFDDDRDSAWTKKLEEQIRTGKPIRNRIGVTSDGGNIEDEATEIFAAGIPRSATLSLEIKRQESILGDRGGGNRQEYSLETLADSFAAKQALRDKAVDPPKLFVSFAKSPIYLHVVMSQTMDETLSLYEDTFCSKVQPVSFESLPADLLKRLKALIAEKAKLNWIASPTDPGDTGGTVKP